MSETWFWSGTLILRRSNVERSDQGQLLKNRVSVRDSAIVNMEHA